MSSLVERLRVRSDRRPVYNLDESDDDADYASGKAGTSQEKFERIIRDDAVCFFIVNFSFQFCSLQNEFPRIFIHISIIVSIIRHMQNIYVCKNQFLDDLCESVNYLWLYWCLYSLGCTLIFIWICLLSAA